jgi:hypothetical protein
VARGSAHTCAAHTCAEDTACECGAPGVAWRGGYDAARETPAKTVAHRFHTGAPVRHARLRITFAGLGGWACGDLCLWSNPIFELRFWGDAEGEPAAAHAAVDGALLGAVPTATPLAGPPPGSAADALQRAGGAAAAADAQCTST